MNTLSVIFFICALFGIGFIFWMRTKSGKKWLEG